MVLYAWVCKSKPLKKQLDKHYQLIRHFNQVHHNFLFRKEEGNNLNNNFFQHFFSQRERKQKICKMAQLGVNSDYFREEENMSSIYRDLEVLWNTSVFPGWSSKILKSKAICLSGDWEILFGQKLSEIIT